MALGGPPVDLKALAARLGAPRFSFGNADDLYALLGVRPGSVTPFALVNDLAAACRRRARRRMLEHDPLNYHPLDNDRTTAIAPGDLLRFIAALRAWPRRSLDPRRLSAESRSVRRRLS